MPSKSDKWDREERDLEDVAKGQSRGDRDPPPRRSGRPSHWSNPYFQAQLNVFRFIQKMNLGFFLTTGALWFFFGSKTGIDLLLIIAIGTGISYGITLIARLIFEYKWRRSYKGGALSAA